MENCTEQERLIGELLSSLYLLAHNFDLDNYSADAKAVDVAQKIANGEMYPLSEYGHYLPAGYFDD